MMATTGKAIKSMSLPAFILLVVIILIALFPGELNNKATVLGAILGVIFSIVTTILFEIAKKPKIILEAMQTRVSRSDGWQYLIIRATNIPLPKWLPCIPKNPAISCHGNITFIDNATGNMIAYKPMPLRWADTQQPITPIIELCTVNCQPTMMLFGKLIDADRINIESKVDIPAGESRYIDIAIRKFNDINAYGFCNKSISNNPETEWKLAPGKFSVTIKLFYNGEYTEETFSLTNDNDLFRIEST